MKKIITILMLFFTPTLTSMEVVPVIAIPGQRNKGSQPDYIKKILENKQIQIFTAQSPSSTDLGQQESLHHLNKAITDKNSYSIYKNKPYIIHATSQGAGTALNYLGENNLEKPEAVILESPLASGNSAIIHTLQGPQRNSAFFKAAAHYSLAHYWIPYAIKIKPVFPYYRPFGHQPIKSIATISIDTPIVIISSKNDTQISHNDACALYYGLKKCGNENIYLIIKDGDKHTDILQTDEDKQIIQIILKKHREKNDQIDLSQYQPDHTPYKKHHENLIRMEKNHEYIFYTFITTTCLSMLYVMRNHIGKLINYLSMYRPQFRVN